MHLNRNIGRIRILAGVDTLKTIARREPGLVESLGRSIVVECRKCKRQQFRMRTRSDSPHKRGVIGIRRDDAAKCADRGSIRTAVISNESVVLDLTGKMMSRTL